MKRLGKKLFSSFLASLAAASLAACGGGSHSALPLAGALSNGASYNGPLADATFKITIPPPPKSSGKLRRPNYVSSSTSKIVFTLNTASRLTAAQVTSFNTSSLGTVAVTLNSATCPGTGPWTCTLTIKLPPGSDNLTIAAEDSSSNILSEQIQTFTVTAGGSASGANNFSATLDANVNTMTISTTSGFCAGSFTVASAQNVPTVGTTTLNFTTAYTDLAGKTIIGPGLPKLSVNGHTDTNGGSGYTDSGTGGTINVKVNQSTQTFTVTPSGSGLTSANVSVSSTPANTNTTSDGLGFSKALSFTVSSGNAPASGLLAAAEQTNSTPGSMAGQVDLFQMTNPSDPTAFGSNSPSTITPAGSPSKDVDNPQDMVFDTNGDLLLANGGAGNPDFGNFACIPAGVITSTTPSASSVTVLTSHIDDAVSLALGTDSSVALTNTGSAPAFPFVEYLLSGTYTEASSTREISLAQASSEGALRVTALPTSGQNPAGSYAAGFTNGTNPPSANACSAGQTPNSSQVIIKHPDGSTATINDNNTTVVFPLVTYDSTDSRLMILSSGACNAASSVTGSTAFLDSYDVSSGAPSQKSSQVLFDAGGSPDSSWFTFGSAGAGAGIAASSTGYLAIGGTLCGTTGNCGPVVQVFQPGTGTRTVQGGPIPFDATTTSGGSTMAYCTSTCFITALKFLTSTKLLIGFQSDNANFQGFYLYNVASLTTPGPATTGQPCTSSTCFDPNGNAVGSSPTFVAFQHTTNHPVAAAYHP